jgi:dephospho-CoA kinase
MLIGICGKSGSGKSTISNIIKDYFDNTVIIDIDKIGHESYNNSQVIKNMIDKFGIGIIRDNKVDRNRLSEIVFNSKEEMKKLEEVTWSYM